MPLIPKKLHTKFELIQLKTKELLRFHFGCHGNSVTIALRYVADVYCPKEHPCQIWTQCNLRPKSYKVKCVSLLF